MKDDEDCNGDSVDGDSVDGDSADGDDAGNFPPFPPFPPPSAAAAAAQSRSLARRVAFVLQSPLLSNIVVFLVRGRGR